MRRNRLQRGARRAGFTLLEILLVVGIIVTLAALVLPNFIGMQDAANIKIVKTQVKSFENAFQTYKLQYMEYPSSSQGFSALTSVPPNAPPGAQPIMGAANLTDPWGNHYNYAYPGSKNSLGGPDIWSNGPDKQSGTADDIGNWSTAR